MTHMVEMVPVEVSATGAALPSGIVDWGDAGAIVVVLLVAALLGMLLGNIRRWAERPVPVRSKRITRTQLPHPA